MFNDQRAIQLNQGPSNTDGNRVQGMKIPGGQSSVTFSAPFPIHDSEGQRDSTVPLSSIGLNLLSEDLSDDDDDSIRFDPHTASRSNIPPSPLPQIRAGATELKGYRDKLAENVKSLAGEVEVSKEDYSARDTFYDETEGGTEMIASDENTQSYFLPSAERDAQQPPTSSRGKRIRPPTIVDFPSPQIVVPSTPSTPPARSRAEESSYPIPPSSHLLGPGQYSPQRQPSTPPRKPIVQTSVHVLPPPSSPISPMLAAPPQSHVSNITKDVAPLTPPISPFARPEQNRTSAQSDNASIRGFEFMVEKKALFRGGEEELMVPFSPRHGPRGGGNSGIGGYPRVGANGRNGRGISGVDFWKRFSVSVRLDEAAKEGKDESWLAREQKKKNLIKNAIYISLLVLVLIIGGVIAFVVVHNRSSSNSAPSTSSTSSTATSASSTSSTIA